MPADKPRINILLVDDERRASITLINLLMGFMDPSLNIVGIANDTQEARQLIAEFNPDVIFLDIEMPEENAFQFLEKMKPFRFEIIFVTAYDEFAIKAFKLNAIDYILKPVSISELKTAVQRLKARLNEKKILARQLSYTNLWEQVTNKLKPKSVTIRDGLTADIIDFKDICFVGAQGSYSRIVFKKDGKIRELMTSYPVGDYEDLLPTDIFYRIHRSYLINCLHIEQIVHDEAHQVMIDGNFCLPISRRRYLPLLEFLKAKDEL